MKNLLFVPYILSADNKSKRLQYSFMSKYVLQFAKHWGWRWPFTGDEPWFNCMIGHEQTWTRAYVRFTSNLRQASDKTRTGNQHPERHLARFWSLLNFRTVCVLLKGQNSNADYFHDEIQSRRSIDTPEDNWRFFVLCFDNARFAMSKSFDIYLTTNWTKIAPHQAFLHSLAASDFHRFGKLKAAVKRWTFENKHALLRGLMSNSIWTAK
jgi:hypothetical protein